MACAILKRISDFEPLSETTAPRYLKLVTSFCPFYLDLPLDVIGVVWHQFGFISTDFYLTPCIGFVKTFN